MHNARMHAPANLSDFGRVKRLPLLAVFGVPANSCRAGHQGVDREDAAASRGQAEADDGAASAAWDAACNAGYSLRKAICLANDRTHKGAMLQLLFAQELGCQSLQQAATWENQQRPERPPWREGEWRRGRRRQWQQQRRLACNPGAFPIHSTYWRSAKTSHLVAGAASTLPTVASASSAATRMSPGNRDSTAGAARRWVQPCCVLGLLTTG